MPGVSFKANGSETLAYLARPEIERASGVVVLQEWWGLDDHIRSVCDRLATAGFFALAPDLYGGVEPTTQPDEAQQRMMALSMDRAEKDMAAAAEYLVALDGVEGGRVGALGFCLGGGLAVWAAAASPLIGATVSYYYVMPHGKPDFSKITGPVLGHFGRDDAFVSLADARALEAELSAAGVDTTFEFYEDAGHAFFNDTNRLGTYDPDLAARSWERTVAFLRAHLTAAAA
jgi:carboxymethylenebutenolidase